MNQPIRILVVDDDKDFVGIVATKLRAAGFEVAEAYDGKQGLERVRAVKPALVILDVQMPILNGIDALIRIKKDSELRDIKVVLLTNFGDAQSEQYVKDKNEAIKNGADDYFLKSTDLKIIIDRVKNLTEDLRRTEGF